MKKYYPFIRMLHLYFGLFISPFVLIFSISVIAFNHPGLINQFNPVKDLPEIKTQLDQIPYDTTDLLTAKAIIEKLNIKGEIDFISSNKNSISFPVNKPGLKTFIRVNTTNDSVSITQKHEGFLRSSAYLHSMPGPHNVKNRGNYLFIKVWSALADTIVYIIFFLSVSGIFLWYFIKSERMTGIYSFSIGILILFGLLVFIF
jgi:hypothetical protein